MTDYEAAIEEYRAQRRAYHRFMCWVLTAGFVVDATVIVALAWRWWHAV